MSQDVFVVIEHLQGQVAEISYSMLVAARALVQSTNGDVVAVLLGRDAKDLANDFAADRVFYLDHELLAEFTSDAYIDALSNLVREQMPRAILFGNTSIGTDVACGISVRLDLPMVSQVQKIAVDNGGAKFISQICGGKIMAEGYLPEPVAIMTVSSGGYKPEEGQSTQSPEITQMDVTLPEEPRVKLTAYIEPEIGDVDISKEPILVAVGRGIQTEDNIELAEEIAELLGGAVCSSRPIVDQGWLSTSRMVGKSGQNVKPKLYLALGISGAPEHVEGITNSETIIAINSDPSAPIFDVANYGAEIDLFDLIDVLIEQIEEAKSS